MNQSEARARLVEALDEADRISREFYGPESEILRTRLALTSWFRARVAVAEAEAEPQAPADCQESLREAREAIRLARKLFKHNAFNHDIEQQTEDCALCRWIHDPAVQAALKEELR